MSKFYDAEKLKCQCHRSDCDAVPVKATALAKFDGLVTDWGHFVTLTSASRCKHHNTEVGGKDHSYHQLGVAFDLHFDDRNTSASFAALAIKHGFKGIGVGKTLVHVDDRDVPFRWTYH